MKHGVLTIFRKELARFFGDKRMAFTTILLPGLLIFFLYSFMAGALTEQFVVDDDYTPVIHAVNLPDAIAGKAEESNVVFDKISNAEVEEFKTLICSKDAVVLAVFPANFESAIATYTPDNGNAPAVALYYNSANVESQSAYNTMFSLLDSFEATLSNRFDVNPGESGYDLATDEDTAGTFFASMLPMLLMMFLFSGCMSVAPESIAGEKERGTIATLLITPLKRSHLALGKICALSIIALLAGASSTLGTLLSLPKLMQMGGEFTVPYDIRHYLSLTVIILSTVLLIVAVISVISAFSKSIKEAQTYITPLMILVTLIGITAMFGNGPQQSLPLYFVPFYNTVQAMTGIFSFQLDAAKLAVTVVSNLVYTGAGVFVLTRMFNSEKVMFQK